MSPTSAARLTPAEAPLPMPAQSFAAPFRDPAAPDGPRRPAPRRARAAVFSLACLLTLALSAVMADWFAPSGINGLEGLAIAAVAFSFYWIALSVATALLGACLPAPPPPAKGGCGLDIAVLLPLYGEAMAPVTARAHAMLEALARRGGPHRYSLYLLSDTRGDTAAERAALATLRSALPGAAIWYRHRAQNTDFKAGNIADWVRRWGARHDAMLVLDADSLMTAPSIRCLADAMAADPRAGLIQSVPRLIGGVSLFARMQQFANAVQGTVLSRGIAAWSGDASNFWGHNALIRTRAFAAAAGLPRLPGRRPFGGTIQSHDFVEAALLVRAGWAVRFERAATGSFEEAPETVIDFVLRDRRWCQGNLQHLRLLAAAGLHPLSRFHLFHGAMAYGASLGWLILLVAWAAIDIASRAEGVVYFSPESPLLPVWPAMDAVSKAIVAGSVYATLLAPKAIAATAFWLEDPSLASAGGRRRFAGSMLLEVLFSFLLAPMMMVQTSLGILRTLAGWDTGWRPKAGGRLGARALLRFHGVETALGVLLLAGMAAGALSLWLAPIAGALAMTPALSALSGLRAPRGWFLTPQEVDPPAEARRAAWLLGDAATDRPEGQDTAEGLQNPATEH